MCIHLSTDLNMLHHFLLKWWKKWNGYHHKRDTSTSKIKSYAWKIHINIFNVLAPILAPIYRGGRAIKCVAIRNSWYFYYFFCIFNKITTNRVPGKHQIWFEGKHVHTWTHFVYFHQYIHSSCCCWCWCCVIVFHWFAYRLKHLHNSTWLCVVIVYRPLF